MHEIVGNLHLHTLASDGAGTHQEVAQAAARAGLDFIVFTDHNVCLDGVEGWHKPSGGGKEVLLLMGEEVNDEQLQPEANHLLCYAIGQGVEGLAADPQRLIDGVNAQGGICFLAHPLERPGLGVGEAAIPWLNWEVENYLGLELWNYMSEAKSYMQTKAHALLCAFQPDRFISGPFPETLAKWDELLGRGQKVVAIGNTDAHANVYSMGPLRRAVYPYEYLFQTVNTHLLLAEPLSREVGTASLQIRDALRAGHCFVGYDLIGATRGFRFTARGGQEPALMGDDLTLAAGGSIELEVRSPCRAEITLLKDGQAIQQVRGKELTLAASEPGVYRVEARRPHRGRWRGWVFSNPIYIR
ncbi:MAG: CehA/McbA family metallohydrolase [Anaerolineae bacterium]